MRFQTATCTPYSAADKTEEELEAGRYCDPGEVRIRYDMNVSGTARFNTITGAGPAGMVSDGGGGKGVEVGSVCKLTSVSP